MLGGEIAGFLPEVTAVMEKKLRVGTGSDSLGDIFLEVGGEVVTLI